MRFIEPSPGEAYDRFTILSLKIANAMVVHKEEIAGVFQRESEALQAYIKAKGYEIPPGLHDELHKINEKLWRLEDEQRERLKQLAGTAEQGGVLADIGENAVSVIQLNDARAEIVQRINRACGINHPEKLYGLGEQPQRPAMDARSGIPASS
jgi:hypothetical protein